MGRKVFRATLLLATFGLIAAGCGGESNPDVIDAIGDGIIDTISPDTFDVQSPDVHHDTVNLDEGRDTTQQDTADPGDSTGDDATDAVTPDETVAVDNGGDGTTVDTLDDAPDGGDTEVQECLSDEECIGKITLTACKTPHCNEDNICEAINLDDDTECSDNSICTTEDKCVAGECVGTPVDCNDNLECTQDLCSEANYCYHRPYYGPCNDANACTENDSCATGTCIGVEFTCNDNNSCTTDFCDINTGCGATKLSGIKCDDGDSCTKADTCANGVCVGTFDCDDGNPCTLDGCNELGCTHEGLTGDICDDGLTCTVNDSCQAGTCQGTAMVCDDSDPCTDDYCQEGVGCKTRFNTATCDDGNSCTRSDRCQYGLCKGTSYSCPILTCMDDNQCDGAGGCVPVLSEYGTPCAADANQCTDDICSSGACIHPNSTAGTACNDNNLCTQTDECSNGVCVGKNPVECNVADACKDPGTCNPATGTCTLGVLPEGSTCNDGLMCTRNDRCTSGACTGTPVVCVAPSDCHQPGQCNPDDGTCNEVFKGDGSPCNDSNPCTQTDQCVQGSCVGGNPVQCTALDQCHIPGACNPSNGQCSNPNAPNDTACNDGQACTKADKCTNGFCGGLSYTCNDNLSCTNESCDGTGGCVVDIIDNWCRINSTCVLPDSVNPGNMCQTCNPTLNQEDWSPLNGGFCNDSNDCTLDDVCVEGECLGSIYSCDDGISCTFDVCDGLGGCTHPIAPGYCLVDNQCYMNDQQATGSPCLKCNPSVSQTQFTPRQDGESCDDGVACTHTDQCASNVCSGVAYTCDDSLECTSDSCRGDGTCLFMALPGYCQIAGQCVAANTVQPGNLCAACLPGLSAYNWSAYREGESCDDGSLCTDGDKCASGVCSGAERCDDEMDCTDDFCNAETGECTNTVHENYCTINGGCYFYGDQNGMNQCLRCIPDTNNRGWTETTGRGCSDNDACTVEDTCQGATCVGTPMGCDDGLACTSDFCSYGLCGTVPVDGWCVIGNECITAGMSPVDNPCLVCDPSENPYAWSYTPLSPCDDGDACSTDDTCVAGSCVGIAYDCGDGINCTVDTCVGNGTCEYSIVAGMCLIEGGCYETGEQSLFNECEHCDPATAQLEWSPDDGASCDDFNDCTSQDQCLASACAGAPYDCDDGRACTADACNGDGTCSNTLVAGWCLIDETCYRDQTLQPGNICSACLSATNSSAWSANNGLPCDDGLDCTKIDTCTNSACVGTAYTCDDGKVCTADACDGKGGCTSSLMPGYCMIDHVCYSNNQFNPDNICEKCSAGSSTSEWTPADGFACDDFDSCTMNTTCSNGTCGGGTAYSCDDGIMCTVDSCDGSGGCNPSVLANDACFINNICYKAGDEKPGVPCEACDPSRDKYAWTDLSLGAVEICNGVDDGCDGTTDPEGSLGCVNYYRDNDIDGVGQTSDFKCLCQPNEIYRATVSGDCDDNEPQVYAGRQEVCDGLDNDCDGVTDGENTLGCQVFFYDEDGDTWGIDSLAKCLCSPTGHFTSLNSGDCDDTRTAVNPAMTEVCNALDDDCDGRTDPPSSPGCIAYYLDTDSDGFGDPTVTRCLCAPTTEFHVLNNTDCNDLDGMVSPIGTETCNGIDDDCSGTADDAPLTQLCPHNPEDIQHATVSCSGSCVVNCEGADQGAGQAGWYDVDNDLTNGCECQGDVLLLQSTMSRSDPYNLGLLTDDNGDKVIQTGKLNVAGHEEWFVLTGVDRDDYAITNRCDTFNLDIRMLDNPDGEFEFDVYRLLEINGVPTLTLECEGTEHWNFFEDFYTPEAGECPCSSAYEPKCDTPPIAECVRVHGVDSVNYCNGCPGQATVGSHSCGNSSRTMYIKVRRTDTATPTCSTFQFEVSNGVY